MSNVTQVKVINGRPIVSDEQNVKTRHFDIHFTERVSTAQLLSVFHRAYEDKELPEFIIQGYNVDGE